MKKLLLLLAVAFCLKGKAQIITTFAGSGMAGYSGDGGQATNAEFNNMSNVSADIIGNLYVADTKNHRVRKITTAGIITTIAGGGMTYPSGVQATTASLSQPNGIAISASGNVFISDGQWVYMVNASTGNIDMIAGQTQGYGGDGGPAYLADLNSPMGLALDPAGNLYIADYGNNRIRKIDFNTGTISTVAGDGTYGSNGDGGFATNAQLSHPTNVAFDASGNLYFSDYSYNYYRIRKVDTAGIITTVVGAPLGTANPGGSGWWGPATQYQILGPRAISFDLAGNLYFVDTGYQRVFKVASGNMTVFAGGGFGSSSIGDGGPANGATLNFPIGLAIDASNNMYVADSTQNRIRVIKSPVTITFNNPNPWVCAGNSTTLVAHGASTYTWTPATGLSAITGSMVVASPTVSTTYTVSGTLGDSTGINTLAVTINPFPTITVNSPTICTGGVAFLNANGAYYYNWSNGSSGSAIVSTPTATTIYTVNGSNYYGCSSSATATVTVNSTQAPTAPVLSSGNNPVIVCQGIAKTLNVIPDVGSVPIWYSGLNIINRGTSYFNNDSLPGTKVITIIDSSITTGCMGGVLTVTITVNTAPATPYINNPNMFLNCRDSGFYQINTGGANTLWSYNLSMSPVFHRGNNYTPGRLPVGTNQFYVSDSSSVNGCLSPTPATSSIPVSLPSVSFTLTQDTAPRTWDALPIYSTSIGYANWYWGDGTSSYGLYPSHTYSVTGRYTICVTGYCWAGGNDSAMFCQNDSIYRLAYNSTNSNMAFINVDSTQHVFTSISQISGLNSQISIYPNPNSGTFVIETNTTEKQTIQLFDVHGKLILTQTIQGKTTINAANLAEGVYNLSVISSEGVVNKRLVIVR